MGNHGAVGGISERRCSSCFNSDLSHVNRPRAYFTNHVLLMIHLCQTYHLHVVQILSDCNKILSTSHSASVIICASCNMYALRKFYTSLYNTHMVAVVKGTICSNCKWYPSFVPNTETKSLQAFRVVIMLTTLPLTLQATVPLSTFRSNSKFDENTERSSFKYTGPITTIFCTRHDSDTVVTCAKYRCDRPRIFYTRVFWIFIEFRIWSKCA